jgi:hypothetical protein
LSPPRARPLKTASMFYATWHAAASKPVCISYRMGFSVTQLYTCRPTTRYEFLADSIDQSQKKTPKRPICHVLAKDDWSRADAACMPVHASRLMHAGPCMPVHASC